MLGNNETNADAYDVTCRVPGCGFHRENLSPTLVAMFLIPHIKEHRPIGGPVYALRIREGFEGTDPENPTRTPEDGWNRKPNLTREEIDEMRSGFVENEDGTLRPKP